MSNIYIVQHCQSEHHVNELTGGWTDTPLTALGHKQAEAVANVLKQYNLTNVRIISSDLKRAFMTAEHIASAYQTTIEIEPLLREICNGEAINKTKKWAEENTLFKSERLVLDKPLWRGSETPIVLYNRVTTFIKAYLQFPKEDIIIVSHGIAIGYLIASWLNLPIESLQDSFIKGNAGGISVLSLSPMNQRTLTMFNNTSHLPK